MIPQRWQPLFQLVLARMREFVREPEVIFWVYGFPLILAVGLGYAFNNSRPPAPEIDIQATPGSSRADEVAKQLTNELWRDPLKVKIHTEAECEDRLLKGKAPLYLIPLETGVRYRYDETRAESVQARYWVEAVLSRKASSPTVSLVEEKGNRYIDFLIPGLVGINIMGGGLFGVGFVLVDMRVRKLFKRLIATPMRHSDFLLALLVSRLIFLIPEMASLLCVGAFWFEIPIRGSFFTLVIVIVVGASAFSGLGLLVGSRTDKTETASGLINMVMLPMYIVSGVFFSSKRFPDEVQWFIQALPLTQLNDALREVMLEGASLATVGWRIAILAGYAIVPFALALKFFKWR